MLSLSIDFVGKFNYQWKRHNLCRLLINMQEVLGSMEGKGKERVHKPERFRKNFIEEARLILSPPGGCSSL